MSPFHLESNGSDRRLRLTGEITVEHARELHAALVAADCAGATLQLDARAVTRLDAAAVQVLLAVEHETARTETIAASDIWLQSFKRFGVDDPAFAPSLAT